VVASSILLALASAVALEADNPVFPEGMSCRAAVEAELVYGSKARLDVEKALATNAPVVFDRPFRGRPASIVYLCNGGALQDRLIYVDFDSQDPARESFDAYRSLLTHQLGEPCEDALSRPRAAEGREPEAQHDDMRSHKLRIEWVARDDAIVSVTYMPRDSGV